MAAVLQRPGCGSASPGRVSRSLGRVPGTLGRLLSSVLLCLLLLLLPAAASSSPGGRIQTGPRLLLSHTELRQGNSSTVFWDGGVGGGYQALLLDEDRGWLLVGGRDHVYLFLSDQLEKPAHTIYWPAAPERVDHCRLAGKNLLTDCANFVRLLQPFNKTHVYACGTGAYYPQCTLIHLGDSAEKPSLQLLTHTVESGRGKCPFNPREPFTARMTDGNLYAGTSVDFMGANAAIFRTPLQDYSQRYLRTEAYQDHWLNEPEFVGSFSIPDTHSPDDDKVYFFFKETAVEALQWDKRVYSRVARVCKNDMGGKRSLINRWSTFLKARLVCSVPGPGGLDTQFDELEDIFVLETKDPQNPVIYGVFSTSSSVFRGSAVCVYSMSSIRAAFNGPFAHKEGPDYRWVEYRGRIPYPRPGTCPSETYDPLHKSTRDFPDELVSFMRGHQLMLEPVLPLGRRPAFTRVSAPNVLRRLVVDRVEAEDGQYDVFHLGTDDGKVLKVVSIAQGDGSTEEIILEELTVFQDPTPILSMEMSTKRQQLYVSGDSGVVQLALQRCDLHGKDCPACCLARDPYCAWDGQACSTYFHTNKRRARRQDVKYGDPASQCHDTGDGLKSVEVKQIYGVESNSTFLECLPRPQHASITWTVQQGHTSRELVQGEEGRVWTARGLLIQHLEVGDAGVYTCVVREHAYSRALARYGLQVIPKHHLTSLGPAPGRTQGAGAGASRPRHSSGLSAQLLQKHYKELQLEGAAGMSVDQYCEQLWYREKRRQQKLLKWKQEAESRKARVRRHRPFPSPYDGPPDDGPSP